MFDVLFSMCLCMFPCFCFLYIYMIRLLICRLSCLSFLFKLGFNFLAFDGISVCFLFFAIYIYMFYIELLFNCVVFDFSSLAWIRCLIFLCMMFFPTFHFWRFKDLLYIDLMLKSCSLFLFVIWILSLVFLFVMWFSMFSLRLMNVFVILICCLSVCMCCSFV